MAFIKPRSKVQVLPPAPLTLRGKFDDKSRALPHPLGFGANGTAVRFDNVLCNIEAVPGGVDIHLLRILAMTSLGEEILLILVADADTRVLYRKHNTPILFFQ